ncbi:MAG: hypothetical protein IKA12_04480 [Clostridia bacterium]|nr:hypothetical protein [Clostridia bacterium]
MNGLRNEKNNKQQSTVFTKQTLGVVLVLFATVCLICLITRGSVFYTPGRWINSFLFGCFGYFAYAVDFFAIYVGAMMVLSRKSSISSSVKFKITALCFLTVLLLHVISHNDASLSYAEYLKSAYMKAENGIAGSTAGGLVISLVSYWLINVLSVVGSYVIISLLIVGDIYLLTKTYLNGKQTVKPEKFNGSYVSEQPKEAEVDYGVQIEGEKEYPVMDAVPSASTEQPKPTQKLFVNNAEDFALKSKRELNKRKDDALRIDYSNSQIPLAQTGNNFSKTTEEELKKKIEYIKTPASIDVNAIKNDTFNTPTTSVSGYVSKTISEAVESHNAKVEEKEQINEPIENDSTQTPKQSTVQEIPMYFHDESKEIDDTASRAEDFVSKYFAPEEPETIVSEPEEVVRPVFTQEQPIESEIEKEQLFQEETTIEEPITEVNEPEIQEPNPEEPKPSPIISDRRSRGILFGNDEQKTESSESTAFTSRVVADRNASPLRSRPIAFTEQNTQPKPEEPKPEKKVAPINRIYNRPPIDLLEKYAVSVDAPQEDHQGRQETIKQLLADFHINVEPQGYVQGPTITRYEIMMPPGISVKKVLNYDDDLKMRLASRFGVRIEAPIPGKNLVGIEVANNYKTTVGLREVLEGITSADKPGALTFAIGKDIVGNSITDNLAKGPHYLIAGATGSGKSVALNVMIVSLIMRYSPEELRLILIDPKRVGFKNYEHIPHLMIDEIITEPQKAVSTLAWAYEEMEKRYGMFENCDRLISDIDEYNKEIASDTVAKLPRIVIIVDELADLMETCKKDMDMRIRMLAAKARAAGIHLVLATQRPSVDVITGTIKANLPSRMALKVMNYADSSTILSEGGAEKLLGNGDMLYKNSGMSECERYQGAWISNREITNIVNFIKEHNEAYFDDELSEYLEKANKPKQEDIPDGEGEDGENEINDFFLKALWLAVNSGSVSISQLQRRFQIGYGRAGGLVDKMERMGFISGNEGAKARRVFLTREEFEEKFGPMSDSY